jgi:Chorismate synthase
LLTLAITAYTYVLTACIHVHCKLLYALYAVIQAGLGSPVFDKLEADLAKACMSLPASKGFEVYTTFYGIQCLSLSTAGATAHCRPHF